MSMQRSARTQLPMIAKLSAILTIAVLQNCYACAPGYMAISTAPVRYSCQKIYAVTATPVPVMSNEDCPAGSEDLSMFGSASPCRKAINGHSEIVLRSADRCPIGYERFVDTDGSDACKMAPANKVENDPDLNGF
jgi:hypothetical protein